MYIQLKTFSYWKTEHRDIEHCQDAYELDPGRGLFVVADGAGTTLYPAIWARLLVMQYLKLPLMSNDPFEIEWWVRQAQNEYHQRVAALPAPTAWNALQKTLQEGSASTLAALRVSEVTPDVAQAQLLIFGDSCVITCQERAGLSSIQSFVLQRPEEFERGPICLHSELKFFRRSFHICALKSVEFQEGDRALLVTDAVARWILSCGEGTRATLEEAFEQVYRHETATDWQQFIEQCRAEKSMIDDDATALILTFKADAACTAESCLTLGATFEHEPEQKQERELAYAEAFASRQKEQMALIYGDGGDFTTSILRPAPEDIEDARQVADALREVLTALQQARTSPDFAMRVGRVWHKHAALLLNEPCAANVRETLKNRGIIQDAPPVKPQFTTVEKERPDASHEQVQPLEDQKSLPDLQKVSAAVPQPQTLVSIEEGKMIDAEQFRSFYVVQREYRRYLAQANGQAAYAEHQPWIDEQLAYIQNASDAERFPDDVLDQLVDHILIREAIQDLTHRQGVDAAQFEISLDKKIAYQLLLDLAGNNYQYFLEKYDLKRSQIFQTLEIIQCAICFARHVEQWIARTTLQVWLRKQRSRKAGKIVYMGPTDSQRRRDMLRRLLPEG